MSFPRYKHYKDSGVEWLGEVPEHWEVISIKWLSPVLRGASPRPIDDPKYFDDDGEYAWVRIADVTASAGILQETTQKLSVLGNSLSVKIEPNELFVSIAGSVGKPCISSIKACIHDGFVYFPRLKINPKFLYRIFESGTCYAGLGKWGTQLNLNTDTIGAIRIALPSQEEIDQLLAFLDRETDKIDALVAEQQRLIELLKEKRQAVISHAVTKGLNPDVPMKDSGVEWLGEVPEHWEVKRLGVLANLIQTGPFGSQLHSEDYVEDETPVINPSNIQDNQIIPDWSCTVGQEIVERLSQHKLIAGDIVFGRRGEMGRCARVSDKEAGWLCGTGCLNVRLNRYVIPELVSIYLRTPYVREFLKLESVGSTMDNLNTAILSRILIPTSPLEEQSAIVAFLDQETAKLDTLTTEAQRAITLLQERRTALISAAVTGKIDVRGLVSDKRAVE
jgi:type I restriction enzyme S subunit